MSRILKWTIKLDDQWHEIGSGPVALVAETYKDPDYMSLEGHFANVWTIEPNKGEEDPVERIMSEQGVKTKITVARIYGTGHEYPNGCEHLGSYKSGRFVWHVVSRRVYRKEIR